MGFEHEGGGGGPAEEPGLDVVPADEPSLKASDADSKVDDGNIMEAESSLREGLSLNYEEARALLGRLEYQKGNVEAALRVFEGIDLHAAIQRLQPSLSEKPGSKSGRPRSDSSTHSVSQHAASLVLEAIYLKSMSLQKLGKAAEAAQECRSILDAVEKIFQNGIPDVMVEQKLQDTVSKAVELLPELWKQVGRCQEALASYRRALLNQWNLSDECLARIQKRFAVFLLYGGVEAGPPSLASQIEGSFIPKNNLEEAILLLMILLRKWSLGKTHWDPAVMEHLTFALSICGQPSVLAKHFEEVLPGIYPRTDRWCTLALCYSAAGQNETALNLLRRSLNQLESPNDMTALVLAAKICSDNSLLALEGSEYARRVVSNAEVANEHLRSVGLHLLGKCLGKRSKIAASDQERAMLQAEALKSLNEAFALDSRNPDLIFDIGLEYAEQRNMNTALRYAKEFVDCTGGSVPKGWKLLALVLSAQQRYAEAQVVTDAALDQTSKWDQGPLLRIKSKLKVAQMMPLDAVEAYRYLLALVQAQQKASGSRPISQEVKEDRSCIREFEVWHGLANLYASLLHWNDADICLQKAKALEPCSAATLHTEGSIQEAREQIDDALASYSNALATGSDHVPSNLSISALLAKRGPRYRPVAHSFLSDALRLEPGNRTAWYLLGGIHRDDGRISDAADCFQAAVMLDESNPIETFDSLS